MRVIAGVVAPLQAVLLIYWLISALMATTPPPRNSHKQTHKRAHAHTYTLARTHSSTHCRFSPVALKIKRLQAEPGSRGLDNTWMQQTRGRIKMWNSGGSFLLKATIIYSLRAVLMSYHTNLQLPSTFTFLVNSSSPCWSPAPATELLS